MVGLRAGLAPAVRPWVFELADRATPATLWQGGADHRVPPAWAQRLADASRRSSVRLLPDEGHVLLLSQGEQVLRDLVSS